MERTQFTDDFARDGADTEVTFTRPGKPTKKEGKSPFFMGQLTISMAIFNSYVSLPVGYLYSSHEYSMKNTMIMVDASLVGG